MNKFSRSKWRYCIVASLLAIASQPAIAETRKSGAATNADLASLDSGLQSFSSNFYTKLNRFNNDKKIDTIDTLAKTLDRYREQNQPVRATAIIINNLGLVEKNIDTTPIINICKVLLEANEWNTASQLYSKIKKQGDKSLVSNISLSLAKYHFSRNQWKETIAIVETIRSDLPPEDYHHALLMHGVSLQQLQKHRLALVQYARVPKTSRYYAAARLNMAIANIRQHALKGEGIALQHLDMGGGLGISYDGGPVVDPSAYVRALIAATRDSGLQIAIEPGRVLVGPAGVLLTTVVDVKQFPGAKKFVVVDAGMTELMRPALYNAFHRIEPVILRTGEPGPVDIVGPICESTDTYARDRLLAPVEVDDLLVVRDVGAYGAGMAHTYLRRPLSPEVMVDRGEWRVIRRRQTLDELLSLETE